jgi:hypothetical protein
MKRLLLGIVLVFSPFIAAGCTTSRAYYQHGTMNQGSGGDVNTETPEAQRAYPQEVPW